MKGWREQTNYNNYQCRQAKFEWLPDKVVFKPWLAAIICVISIDAALLWDNLFTVDDRYYMLLRPSSRHSLVLSSEICLFGPRNGA